MNDELTNTVPPADDDPVIDGLLAALPVPGPSLGFGRRVLTRVWRPTAPRARRLLADAWHSFPMRLAFVLGVAGALLWQVVLVSVVVRFPDAAWAALHRGVQATLPLLRSYGTDLLPRLAAPVAPWWSAVTAVSPLAIGLLSVLVLVSAWGLYRVTRVEESQYASH